MLMFHKSINFKLALACSDAGCALVGGETAEMPSMYKPGDYDLVGFTVGAVERNNILPKNNIDENHTLLGIASSGIIQISIH